MGTHGYSLASCRRSWRNITLARFIQDDDSLGRFLYPIIDQGSTKHLYNGTEDISYVDRLLIKDSTCCIVEWSHSQRCLVYSIQRVKVLVIPYTSFKENTMILC